MNRRLKEKIIKVIIYLASLISASLLIYIVGFITLKGYKLVNFNFLISDNNSVTQYINVKGDNTKFDKPSDLSANAIFIEKYGVALEKQEKDDKGYKVVYIDKNSQLVNAKNPAGQHYEVKKNDVLKKINSDNIAESDKDKVIEAFNTDEQIRIKVTRPGGGIWPMLVSTLILIGLSLIIAVPIGVFTAIYLVEYAKQGKFLKLVRFATEALAGIPSIVYGLFGMIFFVKLLSFQQSMLSGSLTLAIILLPTIIRTTEETLKTVPQSYTEGSYALGANKIQTIWKVVMPSTISGILVAIILSIGRIVGESAALLFTAGTFAKVPKGILDSGASLTVRAYMEVKEYANVEMACAIGIVLLLIVFVLNILAKIITKRLQKGVN